MSYARQLYLYKYVFGLGDLLMGFVWLTIITLIALYIRRRLYANHPVSRYFLPALYLKLFAGVALGLIYSFYYGGGDTTLYFTFGRILRLIATERGIVDVLKVLYYNKALDLYTHAPDLYTDYIQDIYFYSRDEATYLVTKLSGIANLLTLDSYVASSLLFSFFSFLGVWALFRVFSKLFPASIKHLAWGVLYLPSVFFWGSGILKDSITLACLGFCVYSLYATFIEVRKPVVYIIIFLISSWVIYTIKVYILLSFLPLILLWIGLYQRKRIHHPPLRFVIAPMLMLACLIFAAIIVSMLSSGTSKYSTKNVFVTAAESQKDLNSAYYYADGKGSSYDIGEYEPTLGGVLVKMPIAVWTTLFRPYPWEARSILVLLSALESFAVLSFFIYLLFFYAGPGRFLQVITTHGFLISSLTFAILFSFMTGISSGNFGNLVRYKIPCMPFFMVVLVVVYDQTRAYRQARREAYYKFFMARKDRLQFLQRRAH